MSSRVGNMTYYKCVYPQGYKYNNISIIDVNMYEHLNVSNIKYIK